MAKAFLDVAHAEMAFTDLETIKKRMGGAVGTGTTETIDAALYNDFPMLKCLRDAGIFSRGDYDILIEGPPGTEKECLARAIHGASERSDRQLVFYTCPSDIARAENATLFWNEIDNASENSQRELLRVFQERGFRGPASDEKESGNIRFIFASTEDLDRLAKQGRFHRELLAQIGQYRLRLPPLSERRCDILPLILWRLRECRALSRGVQYITYTAYDFFHEYGWAENARELQGRIEHIVALTVASQKPDRITFERIRQSFPDFQLSPRKFAEACGKKYRNAGTSNPEDLMLKTWDAPQENDWERTKHKWRHPAIAKYVHALADDEYADVELREVRPDLRPFHLLRPEQNSVSRQKQQSDPAGMKVCTCPRAEWLAEGVSWNHMYEKEGYVFIEDADTTILFDLHKIHRDLKNTLPCESPIPASETRVKAFRCPGGATVDELKVICVTADDIECRCRDRHENRTYIDAGFSDVRSRSGTPQRLKAWALLYLFALAQGMLPLISHASKKEKEKLTRDVSFLRDKLECLFPDFSRSQLISDASTALPQGRENPFSALLGDDVQVTYYCTGFAIDITEHLERLQPPKILKALYPNLYGRR